MKLNWLLLLLILNKWNEIFANGIWSLSAADKKCSKVGWDISSEAMLIISNMLNMLRMKEDEIQIAQILILF